MDKEPGHHETLAPSSFNALGHCAHYLSSGEETPASARGTRIHLVTAEMLRKGKEMETFWLKEPDELEACHWLFDRTKEELTKIEGIEQKVEIWDTLSGKLITFGKCDCSPLGEAPVFAMESRATADLCFLALTAPFSGDPVAIAARILLLFSRRWVPLIGVELIKFLKAAEAIGPSS
jgi:hypothetical protein